MQLSKKNCFRHQPVFFNKKNCSGNLDKELCQHPEMPHRRKIFSSTFSVKVKKGPSVSEQTSTKTQWQYLTEESMKSPAKDDVTNKFCLLRFKDGGTPIVFKHDHIDGKPPLIQLSDQSFSPPINHRIVEKLYKNLNPPIAPYDEKSCILENGHLPQAQPYKGLSLVKIDGSWMLHDHETNIDFAPKTISREEYEMSLHSTNEVLKEKIQDTVYNYVTMADGTIRAALLGTPHVLLTNNAKFIRYAGNILFCEAKGKIQILFWDNQSGHYCTPGFLHHQAGIDEHATFKSRYDRNTSKLGREKTFSQNQSTDKQEKQLTTWSQVECKHQLTTWPKETFLQEVFSNSNFDSHEKSLCPPTLWLKETFLERRQWLNQTLPQLRKNHGLSKEESEKKPTPLAPVLKK